MMPFGAQGHLTSGALGSPIVKCEPGHRAPRKAADYQISMPRHPGQHADQQARIGSSHDFCALLEHGAPLICMRDHILEGHVNEVERGVDDPVARESGDRGDHQDTERSDGGEQPSAKAFRACRMRTKKRACPPW